MPPTVPRFDPDDPVWLPIPALHRVVSGRSLFSAFDEALIACFDLPRPRESVRFVLDEGDMVRLFGEIGPLSRIPLDSDGYLGNYRGVQVHLGVATEVRLRC